MSDTFFALATLLPGSPAPPLSAAEGYIRAKSPGQSLANAKADFAANPGSYTRFLPAQLNNLTLFPDVGVVPDYTGITPLMDLIRFRFRATSSQVDVAFTGAGDWRYKVARTAVVNEEQVPPDWNTIPWLDCPGGNGERVLTLASHPQANRVVQVILQSKTRPQEQYDVPIVCNGGNTNGYDYIVLARPSAGIIDMRVFTILPFRTWTEDLAVTRENGPTADTINVRVKSGFARANNTRWFWWFSGVPYPDRADQDDFTITVAKGTFFEVYRYVCLTSAFVRYNQSTPNSPGETVTTTQKWGDMYVDDNLISNDVVRVWTGTN